MRPKLPRPLQARLCSRAVVTLKTGESFAGVLFEADGGALVLRESAAIGAGEKQSDLPLDGEVLILLADVAFLQLP